MHTIRILILMTAGLLPALQAATIQTYLAFGPSFDSPSLGAWAANVMAGLAANGAPQGDFSTSPDGFQTVGAPIDPAILLYSYDWAPDGFNVWQGQAGPAGNFANEFGTWLFPMVRIVAGPNEPLALEGVQLTSDFGGAPFSFTYGSASATTYGLLQQGIIHDPGGNQVLNNGENPTLNVNELLLIGPGFFFDISCSTNPGPPLCDPANPLTPQQRLAMASDIVRRNFGGQSFTFTWNGDFPVSGSFTAPVSDVPEPVGMSIAGLAILLALGLKPGTSKATGRISSATSPRQGES